MNWYLHSHLGSCTLLSQFLQNEETNKKDKLPSDMHSLLRVQSVTPNVTQASNNFWKCHGWTKLRRKTSKEGKTEAKDSAAPCFLITITISSFKGLTQPLLHITFPFKKFLAKLSIWGCVHITYTLWKGGWVAKFSTQLYRVGEWVQVVSTYYILLGYI